MGFCLVWSVVLIVVCAFQAANTIASKFGSLRPKMDSDEVSEMWYGCMLCGLIIELAGAEEIGAVSADIDAPAQSSLPHGCA